MEYKEFSGKTLESVISEASREFAVEPENIEYEIIDMGSTGLFGFKSKPTIIKAKVKEEYLEEQKEAEKRRIAEEKKEEEKRRAEERAKKKEEERKEKERRDREAKEKREREAAQNEVRNTKAKEAKPQEAKSQTAKAQDNEEKASVPEEGERVIIPIDEAEVKAAVQKFLDDVFCAMGLEVKIDIDLDTKAKCMDVVLSGGEMGILIGKRGQTLDSLQYLVSLIVNKRTNEYVRVKIDTENYRERRQKTLENLAKNLSFKVKRTKRPVSLEPMNPYERRIIHSALQGDRYVTTHSEGEEPFRRVVITLKR